MDRNKIVQMSRDELIDTGAADIPLRIRDKYVDLITTVDACNNVLCAHGHPELTTEEAAQYKCTRCDKELRNFVHNCTENEFPNVYGCPDCDDVCGLCVPPAPE